MTISDFLTVYPGIANEEYLKAQHSGYIEYTKTDWEHFAGENHITYFGVMSNAPAWMFLDEFCRWLEEGGGDDGIGAFMDSYAEEDDIARIVGEIRKVRN